MMRFMASLLLFAVLASPAAGDDWACWRGPDQNGISRETGWRADWPEEGPPIAWKVSVGTGFSSVTVVGGRLYTMGNEDNTDTVYCLDAATGETLWTHAYECPLDDKNFEGGTISTPSVDGGCVYTLSRQGHLFRFDAATGKIHWSINVAEDAKMPIPGWGFAGSPVIHGDLLLLNVGEAGTAVDKATGKVVWTSGQREAGYNTPVLAQHRDRTIILLASGKFFHAVDVESGKELWRHRWLTSYGCNAADAIVDGGRVFISSGYNRGAALLKLSGNEPKVVWANREMQNQMTSSVLLDGHLYGIHGKNQSQTSLRCMTLESGEVQWDYEWEGVGSLMAADGKLILLSEGGELIIGRASPEAFTPQARAKVLSGKCWTVPVLSGGRIYCRNAAGTLVCVDVRGTK